MNLVAYGRASSEGQLHDFGLDVQEAAIRAWALSSAHHIQLFCIDEGVSGTLDASKRPGLACALEALREGTAEGLVVARLDRLARSLAVQEAALAAIWRLGARAFTADAGEVHEDDPDDPVRTALRQMRGAFAQLDRGPSRATLERWPKSEGCHWAQGRRRICVRLPWQRARS